MVSQLPRKRNTHHDAGGGATFTVRGGRMVDSGWCTAFLSLELGNYTSYANITFGDINPDMLRALADELEARLALVPDDEQMVGEKKMAPLRPIGRR